MTSDWQKVSPPKKHMEDTEPDKKVQAQQRIEKLKSMECGCFTSNQSDNEPPASLVSCGETILQSSNQSFVQSELKTIPDKVWRSQIF